MCFCAGVVPASGVMALSLRSGFRQRAPAALTPAKRLSFDCAQGRLHRETQGWGTQNRVRSRTERVRHPPGVVLCPSV